MFLSTFNFRFRFHLQRILERADCLVFLSFTFSILLITVTAALRNDVLLPVNPSWYWRFKTEWRQEAQIVIAGNSRIYRGVDPSIFEQRMEQCKALNAGFSSAVWSQDYIDYVEGLLKMGSKRWVIMGIDPHSLGRPSYGTGSRYEKNGFGDAMEDATKTRIPALWEARWSFLSQRLRPFRIGKEKEGKTDENYKQRFHLNGWVESDWVRPDPEYYPRYLKENRREFQPVDLNTYNRLLKCIQLWRERGINVLALRPPTSPQTEALEDEIFHYNEKKLAVDLVLSGGYWVDLGTKGTYISYDGSHLNSNSARKLSIFLADSIKNYSDDIQKRSGQGV